MAIHGNSCRFVPLYSPKVQKIRVHRHTQNIIPEKSGRQVVDGGRYAAPPLQLGIQSPCALRGVGVAAFWGGRQRRQQLRPDASGSRHRAHCTDSGGGASSRQAAELRRTVSPPTTSSSPSEPPSYREEMRERSGSHGRRRYALRQGQNRRPAGLTAPQWEQKPPAQPPTTAKGTTAGDPVTTTNGLHSHSVHHSPLRPAYDN